MNVLNEKDIIVICTIAEMMKAFFKDFVIIWHDPEVNNSENSKYIAELEKFCKVITFADWQMASAKIKKLQISCHVITSGTNGEQLAKAISKSQSVESISVFCRDTEYHSTWTQNFSKVSCVENEISEILSKIQENLLEWYKMKSSLKENLPASAPIFNYYDISGMNNLHRYLKIIPNFKNREQAKSDFIALSKGIYSDSKSTKLIAEFEKVYNEYNKEQTLGWYTKDSFLYKVTNNCLRIATSDSIQYCRLLLQDIERAIKEQYQTKSKNFNGSLYRGAYLSEQEWSNLKTNTGREIEMHGFFSVSKDKKIAEQFATQHSSNKVLITIIVPKGPNEEEQGFAEIEEFSKFPHEKEILFNVRSRFTVLETEENYQFSPKLKCRHLVLLYGAQGFRKYNNEKSPIREVSIPSIQNISCAHCKIQAHEMPEKFFFVSLKDLQGHFYCCKKCLDEKSLSDGAPLLCVQKVDAAEERQIIKVRGCLLMNSNETKTPFYGYKCTKCKREKQERYFTCVDCGEREKRWCQGCFGKNEGCMQARHNIILETNPFSFWYEKMSQHEFSHFKFHNDPQNKNGIFEQAEMYVENHKHEKARKYYEEYIKKNETKDKDPNLATAFNNLGMVLFNQGEHKKAFKNFEKSLNMRKSIYGDNHPDVAISYDYIGYAHLKQKDYKKALEYYLKSLEIREAVYDSEKNPADIATSHNNIGVVYQNQGEYKKALEHLEKALEIRKSLFGDYHPEVAASYSNIGIIFSHLREYDTALDYHNKALKIARSVYGEISADVATFYHNICITNYSRGENRKALKYHTKSLSIRKLLYGEKHVDIASSYRDIACTYFFQKKYWRAFKYHMKCLEVMKLLYEENHLDFVTCYQNIGSTYYCLEELEKALEYHIKALEMAKLIYGENHAEVATCYQNVATTYYCKGEIEKALEYHMKSLNIRESLYGMNHPDVASSYQNIGCVYRFQGEYKKALENHMKCLNIRVSLYGMNHPDVATCYENIGCVYSSQKDYKKALDFYEKSLEIRKSLYGDYHADVATSYENIGCVYSFQKEYEKALECYEKCLKIRKKLFGENDSQTKKISEKINEIQLISQKE